MCIIVTRQDACTIALKGILSRNFAISLGESYYAIRLLIIEYCFAFKLDFSQTLALHVIHVMCVRVKFCYQKVNAI